MQNEGLVKSSSAYTSSRKQYSTMLSSEYNISKLKILVRLYERAT